MFKLGKISIEIRSYQNLLIIRMKNVSITRFLVPQARGDKFTMTNKGVGSRWEAAVMACTLSQQNKSLFILDEMPHKATSH